MIYKNAELYNIEEMVQAKDGNGFMLSRVPEAIRTKLSTNAQNAAFNGCGTEIRFNMIGKNAKIILRRLKDTNNLGVSSTGVLEVFQGSFQESYQINPQFVGTEETEINIVKPDNIEFLEKLTRDNGFPFDSNLTRVLLPYDWHTYLIDIQGEISPPRPEQVPSRKYLAYGSSITHGGCATRPSGSYTKRTAQLLGADLINLGFAGSAHMEEAIADYIAERKDWDFAAVELGINVIGSWTVEEFEKKVDYFISRIAESNPGKWIFCIDLFTCGMDFGDNSKINAFREVVKGKVESMNMPKLLHICGRDLLSSADGLSIDLVHPSDTGMEEIAKRLSEIMEDFM